jgi:hypothetical protein
MTIWMEWPRGAEHTRVSSVMLHRFWRNDPNAVYIGMPGYAGQTEGPFGKPWECLRDPRGWRAAYAEYLDKRLENDPAFRARVTTLHGKTLICFCKGSKRGLDADCHGDYLAKRIEELTHS